MKRQLVGDSASPVCAKWRKGPMPPNTWNWGGVQYGDLKPDDGFFFADFRGDHVILEGGERIEGKDVTYYCNCLTVPSMNLEEGGK